MARIELNEGQRVYISGPIKGHLMYERKEAFRKQQRELIQCGLVGVNPFENGVPSHYPDEQHLREDLKLLLGCDAILMMDGWEKSVGARLELLVACHCGIKVITDSDTIVVNECDD